MASYNDVEKRVMRAFYEEIAPYVVPEEFMNVLSFSTSITSNGRSLTSIMAVSGSTVLKCIMKALDMDVSTGWDEADVDIFIKLPHVEPGTKLSDIDAEYKSMRKFLKKSGFRGLYGRCKPQQTASDYPMYKRFNIQFMENLYKNDKKFQLIYVTSPTPSNVLEGNIENIIKGFDFDIVKNVIYTCPIKRKITLKIKNLQSIKTKSCPFNIGDSKRLEGSYDRRKKYLPRGFAIDLESFRDKFLNEYIYSEFSPWLVHHIQFPQFSPNILGEGPFIFKIESTYQCDSKKYFENNQRIPCKDGKIEWSAIDNIIKDTRGTSDAAWNLCFFHIYNINHVHCATNSNPFREIIVMEDVPTKGASLFNSS